MKRVKISLWNPDSQSKYGTLCAPLKDECTVHCKAVSICVCVCVHVAKLYNLWSLTFLHPHQWIWSVKLCIVTGSLNTGYITFLSTYVPCPKAYLHLIVYSIYLSRSMQWTQSPHWTCMYSTKKFPRRKCFFNIPVGTCCLFQVRWL